MLEFKAQNIQDAVEYYHANDVHGKRIRYINQNFPKSKWRKPLQNALMQRKKAEAYDMFNLISMKFGIPFEKINQVIHGNYSKVIKFRGDN